MARLLTSIVRGRPPVMDVKSGLSVGGVWQLRMDMAVISSGMLIRIAGKKDNTRDVW